MAARFQCCECGKRTRSPFGCRCGGGRPAQRCVIHGARCQPGCRVCRMLVRSGH
ncbi:hypothetical protein [Nonomuraea sp. PA05]|uniref:hypothetical protein n=1 Tax=Nonomuraea sp. PA05 TaxID=2604466 RepID=UPI001651BBD8|nr:hypothetical protein [Nonomuraea sp. PA05]